MGRVSADKMTNSPTNEQLAQILDAKAKHAKDCPGRTWFDLSLDEIVIRCHCGFGQRIEATDE